MENIHNELVNKPCSHNHLLEDILGGKSSGEFVCAECGYMATLAEFKKMQERKKLLELKAQVKLINQ